jgi:hypothetical protein
MKEVNWTKELKDLIETSSTPEEKQASEAFASALTPYLKDPTMLRTLLGKIQRYISPDSVEIVSETRTLL